MGLPTAVAKANASRPEKPLSLVWVILVIAAQIPMAVAMKQSAGLATFHGYASALAGITLGALGRPAWAACAAAYIAGSEVLWRMTKADVFWEVGKYSMVATFILCLLRTGRLRPPITPLIYFLLLMPGMIKTFLEFSFPKAKDLVSFDLSGPLALTVSLVFFTSIRLSPMQLLRVLIAFMAPVAGMAGLLILRLSSGDVYFGTSSSLAASGGFGPNQVSAALGLACLFAFFCGINPVLRRDLRVVFFGMVLVFAAQSALTLSRGGLYGAIGAVAVGYIFMIRNVRAAIQVTVSMALLVGAAYYYLLPRLDEFTGGALSARFEKTDLSGREEIIEADLKILAEHPLIGVGVGQAMQERAKHFQRKASHTEYTRLLAEHGSFGIAAMLVMAILAVQSLLRARGPRQKAFAAAMLCFSFLYMATNGMRLVLPALTFGLAAVPIVLTGRNRQLRRRPPAVTPRTYSPWPHPPGIQPSPRFSRLKSPA